MTSELVDPSQISAAAVDLSRMALDSHALPSALSDLQTALGVTMPQEYAEFLQRNNGGEGSIGESPLQLWPLEEVAPMNEAYSFCDAVPTLLLFASSGVGTAYAFDTRRDPWTVVCVDWANINLDDEEHWPIATSFTAFLRALELGWEVGDPIVTDQAAAGAYSVCSTRRAD